mmetsp:Transcript_50260/g.89728  ORF Transcript_50260/g.89728 Transcript_50260/m.89728 type:complete len:701 (-) Transcript_50260:634-2736(-)
MRRAPSLGRCLCRCFSTVGRPGSQQLFAGLQARHSAIDSFEERVTKAQQLWWSLDLVSARFPDQDLDGVSELVSLLHDMKRMHIAGQKEECLGEFVAAVPFIREELHSAIVQAHQQSRWQADCPVVYYVSEVLLILASDMQYAELCSPNDAADIVEALEPLMTTRVIVPGLMPVAWRLMRKATNQVKSTVEAVYYAANQLPFYKKAFRQHALVDWCPVEERVSTEEFLYLSRKEILFRQLMELDICAVEAAVSMSHQMLFTQGVLTTTPQEENLIRMLAHRGTELMDAHSSGNWTEDAAAEVAECVLKIAMYFPLCQVFEPALLLRLPSEVPYPDKFKEPFVDLFAIHIMETQVESELCSRMAGQRESHKGWLKRFATLYSHVAEQGSPWWRCAPSLPLAGRQMGYHNAAKLFSDAAEGLSTSSTGAKKVLVLGCGSGLPVARASMLLQPESLITAVDANDSNLAYAQRQMQAIGIHCDGMRFVWADPHEMVSEEWLSDGNPNIGQFDVVECGSLLRHSTTPEMAVQGIGKLLAHGGVAVIGLPSPAAEEELAVVREFVQGLSTGLPRPFLGPEGQLLRMPTVPEVRISRRALLATSASNKARQHALSRKAFFSYTGFIDSFVRSPQCRVSLRDWHGLLQEAGLQVLGVALSMNADAIRSAFSTSAMNQTDLRDWAALEAMQPTTFTQQQDLCTVWCQKL